jgi:hypothetical protein
MTNVSKFAKTLTLPAGVIVNRALLSVKRPMRKLSKPEVVRKVVVKPVVTQPAQCEQPVVAAPQNQPAFQVSLKPEPVKPWKRPVTDCRVRIQVRNRRYK